jgi:glutamate racemase
MIGKDIAEIPIPDLAGAIEFGEKEEILEKKIKEAFADARIEDFDILVLACTHYPHIMPIFQKLFPSIAILDPAELVADRAERELWPREAGNGTTHFVISKDSEIFRNLVAQLFPQTRYTIEVLSV